jgi:hypothetical protein
MSIFRALNTTVLTLTGAGLGIPAHKGPNIASDHA